MLFVRHLYPRQSPLPFFIAFHVRKSLCLRIRNRDFSLDPRSPHYHSNGKLFRKRSFSIPQSTTSFISRTLQSRFSRGKIGENSILSLSILHLYASSSAGGPHCNRYDATGSESFYFRLRSHSSTSITIRKTKL